MTSEAKGRWWEDYLVRYLTPMLVGSGLLSVLLVVIGLNGNISALDTGTLWNSKKEANLAVIVAILVGGFAFAYLCSTPITVFHAGRMIRRGMNRHATAFWYSWIALSFIALAGLAIDAMAGIPFSRSHEYRLNILLFIASMPACWLLAGQYDVIWRLKRDSGADQSEFLAFYARLAVARSGTVWASELRESYTHLREHANSVFICVAELSVSAAIVLVWKAAGSANVFAILMLLSLLVWLVPNVFLWSTANRLELLLIGPDDEDVEPLRAKARAHGRGGSDAGHQEK